MSEEVMKVIKQHAEDAREFSEALWENGDKPNSHFQEGRSMGLLLALKILKEANHD